MSPVHTQSRVVRLIGIALVLLVIATACGSDDDTDAAPATTAAPAAATTVAPAATTAASAESAPAGDSGPS